MGFAHLDRYADRASWLNSRTTPTQRLWIAIVAAFAAGLMPPGAWRALAVLTVVVVAGAVAARVPAGTLARRLVHALPFFLLPALALPFSVPGPTVLELGPFRASGPGLVKCAEIVVRATLAVTAVTIVVSITRATDLLNALNAVPLPRLVKSSLALGYRYVYVLNDEYERTSRALRSRVGRASKLRLWRARASVLANLFSRAHNRGMRIHAAMLSRGHAGQLPTLQSAPHISPAWSAAIVALLAAVWLGGVIEVMR
jgi:cobalt/nickel transport system permease protein